MSEKLVAIALTPEQWTEIFYALDSKCAGIRKGNYGKPDKQWVNELVDIMDEIETNVGV